MKHKKDDDVKDRENEEDPISFGKQYFESQKARVEELKQNTETHPYPNDFKITCTLLEYNEKYAHLKNEELISNTTEKVAGRILSTRRAGSKLYFFDLQSDGAKVQVKLYQPKDVSKDQFAVEMSKYQRGDIIGVEGNPSRTKSGELSINSNTVLFLSYIATSAQF